MAGLKYLWSNRAQFPIGSSQFFKAWGKRTFSFYDLIKGNIRRQKLLKRGARIHEHAEIGRVRIEGKLDKLNVGQSSFLGRVHLALHENVEIGKFVCVNDGVEILTASHDVNDPEWKHIKGKVVIEDYAWIGTGAMILPGVHIGYGAVVGARAVVSKSVPAETIVVGNPAKAISKRRCGNLNYNPCAFIASNSAWLSG